MLARLARYLLAIVSVGLALVTASPLLLYGYGLSFIPEERRAERPAPVPDEALAALWASLGGSGTPELDRMGPYAFALRLMLHSLYGLNAAAAGYFGVPPERLAPEQLAVLIAASESSAYDPWCRPQRNRRQVEERFPSLRGTSAPPTLPAPPGACGA